MTNERTTVPASPNEMMDAWIKASTDAERRWNEYFNQMMGTDAFAQFMSRTAESNAAAQAAFARGMEPYLRALNIPTQADLAKLGERLTSLEARIDALVTASYEDGAGPTTLRSPGSRRSSRE